LKETENLIPSVKLKFDVKIVHHCYNRFHLQDSVISLPRCETLRSLTLDILRNVAMFVNILKSLPHLITFRINSFADNGTNTMSNIISYKHDHLKHLHISLSDLYGSRNFLDYCTILHRILSLTQNLKTFSIRFIVNCNRTIPDSFLTDVVLMLTTIAEHLPIDCHFDCSLRGRMSKGSSQTVRLRWQRAAKDFISEIQRVQVQLARQRPTFGNLRCRCIITRYMEVYT
jgi:hypothetical protein